MTSNLFFKDAATLEKALVEAGNKTIPGNRHPCPQSGSFDLAEAVNSPPILRIREGEAFILGYDKNLAQCLVVSGLVDAECPFPSCQYQDGKKHDYPIS